jgi:FtsH-binding integral membrane protein
MWIFFGILLLVSAPVLVALGLLLSVPVAILLGISAWNDYASPVPLEDALYRIPLFWVIEGVGVLVLLWLIAMLADGSQRH